MNILQSILTVILSIVVLVGLASVFINIVNGIQTILDKRNEQ